jgi:hypothetical protein
MKKVGLEAPLFPMMRYSLSNLTGAVVQSSGSGGQFYSLGFLHHDFFHCNSSLSIFSM